MKKKRTRKTRGFVAVGAKILHLQTHSKRTNTVLLLGMNNEQQLMIKCVRNCSASENCLRLRRRLLKHRRDFGLRRLKEKNFCSTSTFGKSGS